MFKFLSLYISLVSAQQSFEDFSESEHIEFHPKRRLACTFSIPTGTITQTVEAYLGLPFTY